MKRFWKWLKCVVRAGFILAVLLVIAPIIWLQFFPIEPIAQRAVDIALHNYGYSDTTIKIQRLTLDTLIVEDIDLGDSDNLHIDKVTLNYSPNSLLQKRVDNIRIQGLSLKGNQSDDGSLSFGKLDMLLQGTSQAQDSTYIIPALPFDTFSISQSNIMIKAPSQTLQLPFSLIIKPDGDDASIDMEVGNAFITLVNLDIPATGMISIVSEFSGKLPFIWEDGNLILKDGKLHSTDKGIIKFTSSITPNDKGMKLLFDALTDYQYKKFSITLNSDKNGKLISGLALEGSNQSLYDGRDIELNVNLTMNIYDTIKSIMGVYHLSDKVKEGLL